jgi:DNA-directed RNA polymerase omega subunit
MAVFLDKLLPHAGGSAFRLVRMAMLRARELNGGSPALVAPQFLSSDKPTVIAVEEISYGKIVWKKI